MLSRVLSMTASKVIGAAVALAFLVACSSRSPDTRVSSSREQIVNGEPSPAGTIEDAVLLLRTTVDGQELLCSAGLVAKNLLVTARHCLAHLAQGPFNCTVRGELIDNPDGAGQIGLDLPANTLEFYGGDLPRSAPLAHGSSIISTLSNTICVNDIAFVVLDRAVDLPVLPLRLSGRSRVGESVTLVGYGMDETQSDTIDFRTQPRRHKTGLSISGVGPDSLSDGVTTVAPRTLVVDGPSACVADSGGPLLDAETHAAIGIYSLLDGQTCVDPNVRNDFVHVPPFRSLVDEAFRAAGATPVPETARVGDASVRAEAGDNSIDASISENSAGASSDSGCAIAGHGGRVTGAPVWPSLVVIGRSIGAAKRRKSRRRGALDAPLSGAPRGTERFR